MPVPSGVAIVYVATMPLELTPGFVAIAVLAAFLVGLSKGGLPVVAMLSVPMLALSMPPLAAAALLLPLYIASDMVGVWLYRRDFSARNLRILVPSATAGVAVGWAAASLVPDRWVSFLIGMVGLVFCLHVALKHGKPATPRPADLPRGLFWGTLTGFTSFVSHSGGPPFQVYVLPQRLEKLVFAGTSTILFAVVNLVKAVPYWALGQFDASGLRFAAMLVPVAVAGVLAGWRLVAILPERLFFALVQAALFLVSLKLVVDALLG